MTRAARSCRGYSTVVVLATLTALVPVAPPAHADARATTSTVVLHGLTHSAFLPDDICGPRASNVDFTLRTQVTHTSERADGSFSFKYLETGTYHVDFLDPALADQNSQFTESVNLVLAPGGTEVFALAFHDFPTGLKIFERAHLTVVDAVPIVDRHIVEVTGCP